LKVKSRVTPAEAGVHKYLKKLDSRLRGNDKKGRNSTFYETINIGMRLDGLVRVDVPEIDRDAFREAIINAFCHRDYFEYDSVNIAIFKDRLEIRNPGRLYGGLTIKQIRTRMVSQRRNELIADIFHRGSFC